MTLARRLAPASASALLLAGAAVGAAPALNGAGATFPAPLYQRWFADLAARGVARVNYQSVGSGAGIRQFVAGTVDFAASDEPIQADEAARVSRGVVQLPIVGGTIAIAYNKADCKGLKLTQKQLADIFLGRIRSWEQLKCGKGKLTVAHRSDGSGTTFAFTNSLSAFSADWKSKVGEGKSVRWPVGIGGKGNEGVAGILLNTPGAIGYLNQAYVKGALRPAALQNRAGQFVLPNLRSGTAALNNIRLNAQLAGEDPNPAGAGSYPITTLTWLLAYQRGNGAKAAELREVFRAMLSPRAQGLADDLGYVPLRDELLRKARAAVARIGS
ncbi:MAG: phosphate ABC transporter substrate-binding protein PstS [Synechococcaceae bacterium WB4_1_0192]|jgi:phosphate transport system substrate-binding protein|nr:phosphate ABC transporter substrate-binding protein PstS [Synechococcaceae bacterium WB4_1_0192]